MSERDDSTHAGRVEAHRLDGFIDAAFAFAVSVLAIAGAEVPHSLHDLILALDRIPGFACSFATLMMFWHRHVRWRDRFRLHDGTAIVLSLMLVFFALIFVYPLNMLFQAMFSSFHDAYTHTTLPNEPEIGSVHELKALFICYALAYACMAGSLAMLYRHSLRHASSISARLRIEAQETYYIQCGSMAVAILSLLITLMMPNINSALWNSLPGMVYVLLTLVYSVAGRWSRRALLQVT
ncbi:TMEM175 family protein [Dyella caseinilytica]|uniref:DUF1211 domain-containing protein n=1 Tax=Dyella caseinilytica TaxID=1849581 RepID=A0ABX7GS83_9GAMM|nr:TMEM175 family protein [Dyella caseinilytica]QRN53241.1 DUF1211 domain-containing protein [Dyella caseinilytica]GGA12532.1 hypothetical protein GCM10011408_37610 [Dyella caseinilytica]